MEKAIDETIAINSKSTHTEMVQQTTINNDYSSSSSHQFQCFTNNEAR